MDKIKSAILNILFFLILGSIIPMGLVYGIDGEMARRNREDNNKPKGCIFISNCWYK